MIIPLPILMLFESAVNRVLSLDVEAEELLSELEGKVVAVHVSGLDATVFIIVLNKGIELSRVHDVPADTTLTGSVSELFSLLKSPDQLTGETVSIEGEFAVAKQLKVVANTLDIDWEEHLSNVVGDTPAHQLFRAVGAVQAAFSDGFERVEQQAVDWAQKDGAGVVSPQEIESFYADVDQLRSSVDRLEARLNQLEQSS